MAKFALLVGVSDCAAGLPTLRKARVNVQILARSLRETNSGFQIQLVQNSPQMEMAEAIEWFFRQRQPTDQVLCLFSGYGFRDRDGQLYFATPETVLDEQGNLIRARTLPAHFVLNVMDSSPAEHQVLIFDGCVRLPEGIASTAQEELLEGVFDQMIGDRRIILVNDTYTRHTQDPDSLDTWSYTRYLANGLASGGADHDCDGSLTVEELHRYATAKIQTAAPAQHPQFYGSPQLASQVVLQVPNSSPTVQFRQFLEKLAQAPETEIDATEFRILTGRNTLNALRLHLGLSPQEASEIEAEVLRPEREYAQRQQLYQEVLAKLAREPE